VVAVSFDVPLRKLVADAIGTPVSLINDANAFGYGEHRHGAGRGRRLGVYVTLGTGVGGSVIGEGGFLEGAHGLAGEIGHMCVAIDGPPCPCGARGCLEMFVGSARIVELAERKIRSGAPGEAIRRASERDEGRTTPRAIAEAAEGGDWTARAVYAEIGEIVGSALAGVANLLDPDVIVIGGGVAMAGDVLWTPIRRAFDRQAIAPDDMRADVEPARFGADAGLVGAAAFARDES
jgi:glucokinase